MNRILSLILTVILFTSIQMIAQVPEKSDKNSVVSTIKNEENQNSQVMELLSFLSDVYGPRLNYWPEYKEAAEWARMKLKEWGLQNIHYDKWGPVGKGWSLKRPFRSHFSENNSAYCISQSMVTGV